MDQLRRENAQLVRSNQRARDSRDRYKAQARSLESQLAQRDEYILQQAERVAKARGEASQMWIERNEAQKKADAADIDPRYHKEVTSDLAALRERYGELKANYERLSDGLDRLASEREFLKQIARSWDGLCTRLYKQLKGNPRTKKDRETLELWVRFRKSVGRPVTPLVEETL